MKTLSLSIVFAALLSICLNGLQAQTTQTPLNQVVVGSIESVYSKILNEQRRILLYVPSSAASQIYSKQRFPVIYLLDGEATHFSSFAGMIRRLSSNYICPEMIVVGIPNTDRTRDLTPTHMDSWQFLDYVFDSGSIKSSGGGEKFISFIEKELMPHIDSLYPTAPYRMLIGHSFGGLTVMNTLIHHTKLFKAYIAIDPAMSWDNKKLLNETSKTLSANLFSGVSLFLGIANTMKVENDTIRVKSDLTKSTEHIRSLFELRDYLNNSIQNQLNYAYKYYPNDNHYSVPFICEYDALRFIFDFYKFDLLSDDYKNLERIYETVSKHFGYKVKPPESMVNNLANTYLSLKQPDAALILLTLNIVNYPESYNVYNSIGDYYTAQNNKANAIDNYKKALSIKEVPSVRQKLDKLQSK